MSRRNVGPQRRSVPTKQGGSSFDSTDQVATRPPISASPPLAEADPIAHVRMLAEHIGSRPLGSLDADKARQYMIGVIKAQGAHPTALPFSLPVMMPKRADLMTHEGETVRCVPAIGSPATSGCVEGIPRVFPLGAAPGQHEDKEFQGAILLSPLGMTSEAERARMAARRGVGALLLYNEATPELYSPVISVEAGPVPCVAIRRADAQRLADLRTAVRLTVEAQVALLQGVNLLVSLGRGKPTLLLLAHYDTRPGSPGAIDNASGVAVLLHLLARCREWMGPRILVGFLDGEELDGAGSTHLWKALDKKGILEGITGVIYLDGLGSRALGVLTDAESSERKAPLAAAVADCLARAGLLRGVSPSERIAVPPRLWGRSVVIIRSVAIPVKHTPLDRADLIHPAFLLQTSAALETFVRAPRE